MDIEKIKHIAEISYLEFTDEELESFKEDFNDTLNLINQITETNVDGVLETKYVNDIYANLREDIPEESLSVEEALMNTKTKKYSYFQIVEFVE